MNEGILEIRESVQWFAGEMEQKLQENDHKMHWSNLSNEYLLKRLRQEVEELAEALELELCDRDPNSKSPDIIGECADVSAFAMMIADNYSGRPGKSRDRGGLKERLQLSAEVIRPFDDETPYKKLTTYIDLLLKAQANGQNVHIELNNAFKAMQKLVCVPDGEEK